MNTIDYFIEYFGEETGTYNYNEYIYEVNSLIKNGGKIYRLIFVDDINEINLSNMGNHWTTNQYNFDDFAEKLFSHYGNNKKEYYILESIVEPNNISIENVDLQGCPEEREVNIISKDKIKQINIYEYDFNSMGKLVKTII